VLFVGGCGRVMECPPEVLHESLARLAALPGHTRFFCGHEFTEANLRFALSLLPDDPALLEALANANTLRARGEPTVPGTIAQERRANPYLRAAEPAWQEAVGLPGAPAVEVFAELRRRKNGWSG
jgi:hydroxyacylglutathione hydrolase